MAVPIPSAILKPWAREDPSLRLTVSALENPAQLEVPLSIEQKEAYEHVVAYERQKPPPERGRVVHG